MKNSTGNQMGVKVGQKMKEGDRKCDGNVDIASLVKPTKSFLSMKDGR